MTEIIFLVEEDSEGGYVARAIDEAIFTEANTLEELRSMVRDAVQCHFNDIYDEIFADDLAAR
jgi:predicted RNase H-like HicB family nuclease